ncbi:hypothetical protein T492DRAFT_886412 [Pavlovales sp. CCMP2436]|nr:hypothetical protein T492DRAFT_886412 [Pavlovales sp. CCMP2436]
MADRIVLNTVKPIRGIVIGAFSEVSADTHSLVKEIAAQGGGKMYALIGVSPMEAAARIKKQLIDTTVAIKHRLDERERRLLKQPHRSCAGGAEAGRTQTATDFSMSAHYSKLAADQGEAAAQCAYAMACLGGLGVPQDHEESARYYRLAADQGLAHAQAAFGDCYYRGKGVSQDYAMAARYYRLAADQGIAHAQAALGDCYDTGQGGIATGQCNYAMACLHGQGVPEDHEEGARYHRLAADQGFVPSMLALGAILVDDQDVPVDERTLEPALAGIRAGAKLLARAAQSEGADNAPYRLQALELLRSHADKREVVSRVHTAVVAGAQAVLRALG